jgi:hypothetical protein
LREFVDDTPWVHLDIAGTAYLDNESAWQAKGPTGTPVRAFLALIESLASKSSSPRQAQGDNVDDDNRRPNGARAELKV